MNRLKIVKDLYDPSEREGMEDGDWLALVDGSAMGLLFANKSLWAITEPVAQPIWALFIKIDALEDSLKAHIELNTEYVQKNKDLEGKLKAAPAPGMVDLDLLVTAVERIAKALK